jgi:hypothetical protein
LDEKGLEDLLIRHRNQSGLQFVDAIQRALSEVSGLTEFPDDLSAVLIKRNALA